MKGERGWVCMVETPPASQCHEGCSEASPQHLHVITSVGEMGCTPPPAFLSSFKLLRKGGLHLSMRPTCFDIRDGWFFQGSASLCGVNIMAQGGESRQRKDTPTEGGREGADRGPWRASAVPLGLRCWGILGDPTRWTWVSVNSGSQWWTGRPGMLQFMGSQRVGHDWATDLIWSGTGAW